MGGGSYSSSNRLLKIDMHNSFHIKRSTQQHFLTTNALGIKKSYDLLGKKSITSLKLTGFLYTILIQAMNYYCISYNRAILLIYLRNIEILQL